MPINLEVALHDVLWHRTIGAIARMKDGEEQGIAKRGARIAWIRRAGEQYIVEAQDEDGHRVPRGSFFNIDLAASRAVKIMEGK